MRYGTAVESLAASLYSACSVDLPEIVYEDPDWVERDAFVASLPCSERAAMGARERATGKIEGPRTAQRRRPDPSDCTVLMFLQAWGSTALGFGGIGGRAITEAYTVVVTSNNDGISAVYFGGRFAYMVPATDQVVLTGYLKEWKMPSVDVALQRHGWHLGISLESDAVDWTKE